MRPEMKGAHGADVRPSWFQLASGETGSGNRDITPCIERSMAAKQVFGMIWCSLVTAGCLLSHAAVGQSDLQWTVFRNDQNTSVQYPKGVFSKEDDQSEVTPPGDVFTTLDGRARLHIFAYRNDRNETPRQHLARVFPHDRRLLDYDRVTRKFFAVSENKGDQILYRRCNFSDGWIHCIDLDYPGREERAWDSIVTRISLSLRPR